MPDIPLKFSRAEYADRLQKTRRAMEEKGVDLLIVSDPSNMNWLTGYDGWSFYVHQAVIVPPEGEPIFFGRGMDAVGARFTAYLSEDNIIGYADDYVQNTAKHPMDLLSSILKDKGWGARRIGVEMDNYWFTAAAFRDRMDNGRKVAIQILDFFDRQGVTLRRGDLRRINPHRLDLFGTPPAEGRESSPVGRPDFKSGWGSEPVPGGFDSHSPPPESP